MAIVGAEFRSRGGGSGLLGAGAGVDLAHGEAAGENGSAGRFRLATSTSFVPKHCALGRGADSGEVVRTDGAVADR